MDHRHDAILRMVSEMLGVRASCVRRATEAEREDAEAAHASGEQTDFTYVRVAASGDDGSPVGAADVFVIEDAPIKEGR